MSLHTICILGLGGVGGYFGGQMAYRLAQQPDSGKRVYFLARGAHLQEIRQHGLILNTVTHTGRVCQPTLATDTLADIPTPDLYLVCVKSYDLDAVLQAIRPKMYPHTIILPLLNGVAIYDRIRAVMTTVIVLPACVYVGTHIERPGVVTQQGGNGNILCGPDPQHPDSDPRDLLELFDACQLKLTWNADPSPAIWEKFMFIAAFGLVTASSGKTLGAVMADAAARDMTRQVMQEIAVIAQRKGVRLPDKIVAEALAKAQNFPPEMKTSYQRDVETPGKRNESDLFSGAILRLGQTFNVPTPVTARLAAAIAHAAR